MAFFVVGCGADCAALCEDQKGCEGADKDVNCEKTCEDAEKKAEAAGCESLYEDALSCLDDQDDVCKADKGCASENEALASCME
ncbi:MAG TPA: hypothetical protein VFV94_19270 [Polyangiaceae bacterium]|nr:hypothetical protein [Polyangiaceae bacterium]